MAQAVYLGQTVEIRLNTGQSLDDGAGALDGTVEIRYKKPGGTTGSWTATAPTPSTGLIHYTTTPATDLDEAGVWALNAVWTTGAAQVYYGSTVCLEVKDLGVC